MNRLLLPALAILLSLASRGEPIVLQDAIGKDNMYRDSKYGVSFRIPTLWEPISAMRWGKNNEGENTVFFRTPDPDGASPNVYYQMFYADSPVPTDVKAWILNSAGLKVAQRRKAGYADYRNIPDSFVFRTIAGRPACSYSAAFTRGGLPMEECFIRIVGKKGYVMLFGMAPAGQIGVLKSTFEAVAETVVVP